MSEINRLLQGYGGIVPTPEPHDARWIEDMRRIWAAERKRAAETYEREVAQALEQAQAVARFLQEAQGGSHSGGDSGTGTDRQR